MEFIEKIKQLQDRLETVKKNLTTEEATKNALIMPFINALGYDVFNPLEVVPEFVADVGVKKGEKVDYAIIQDNKPVILIECKKIDDKSLDIKKHATQLIRYFSVTEAKFIILTNGVVYKFFSDIEETGKLDSNPFFTFNLANYKETQVEQLKNFSKENFDIQSAFANASDLKYIQQFVDVLTLEYQNPSAEFVKYFINKAGLSEGRVMQSMIDKHTSTLKEAFNAFMSKTMKNVLDGSVSLTSPKVTEETKLDKKKSQVETTIEELEGFAIVKSILNGHIDLKRVVYRDNTSYFNILLDDNKYKNICRLYFNSSQKYISFLHDNKEEKKPISNIDEIFSFKDEIIAKAKELENLVIKR